MAERRRELFSPHPNPLLARFASNKSLRIVPLTLVGILPTTYSSKSKSVLPQVSVRTQLSFSPAAAITAAT